ncbi:hypothetical protein JCM13664_12560 [Methylothermus subterraneus]|nr:hypothetical protein HGMM_F01C09C49 [uncultured Gammaproteobacteria bacterium]
MASRTAKIAGRLAASAALLLAGYALAGFFLLPYLVERYVPRYAQERSIRASIGEVRVNPFLFTFEAKDCKFEEKRLFPTASGSAESGLPGVLVRHARLGLGRLTFCNESGPTAACAQFDPIDLELDGISTWLEPAGRYALTARLPGGGGELRWRGELYLAPFQSSGRIELAKFKPAAVWQFFQDRFNLADPSGTLDFKADYQVAFEHGVSKLLLKDLSLALTKVGLRASKAAEPMLELKTLYLAIS